VWPRLLSAGAGLWLMAAPAALGYDDPAATSDRIVGPIVVTVAVVAMWEATRGFRWANWLCAVWLLLAPWLLAFPSAAAASSSVAGLVVALAVPWGGVPAERFGGGWRALWPPCRGELPGVPPAQGERDDG
jgi:hypothetical protein